MIRLLMMSSFLNVHDSLQFKSIQPILGTMTFSDQTDKLVSQAMLKTFSSNGFSMIDTASMYQDGNTELLIGSILNENPDLRPKIQIATKANPFKPEKGYCLSKDSIIQQLTKSLSSLQTDHGVDLYYLHAPDVNNSLQDSLATIQQEYENGKFKRFGLSNYATWEVVFIHSYMKERGWIVPTVYQGMYNGITRQVETELFPALDRLDISFYAYNPLAGGMLTGKYNKQNTVAINDNSRFNTVSFWGQKYRERYMQDIQFQAIDLIKQACMEASNIELSHASLRWLLYHSKLSAAKSDCVILGASKLDHFESNIKPFIHYSRNKNSNDDSSNNNSNSNASNNQVIEGPLPPSVVEAFDRAWDMIQQAGACPPYQRGISKW